ncbi:MAG: response regulator [Bacteroidia bacterium]|nr:response regulator [Bacteroidia bacterium]
MPVHILVVDDEPDMESLICQWFAQQIKERNWNFTFASNGAEALELLKGNREFHIIITDINMPIMDGLTLLLHLRELNKDFKTIIVSAYGDMDNIRAAMNRGAFDFNTKPIDFNDLENTIYKTLDEVERLRKGKQAQQQLQQAILDMEISKIEKQKAEEARNLERQFMANISHEIRTPMNAIIGMNNLLLNLLTDEKQIEYLKGIKYSAENLLSIINDILDLSKIESGKLNIEKIPFSIRQTTEMVGTNLKIKANEKGINLHIEVSSDIPPFVKGDPVRLFQMLINIGGNAVKFTEKGTVSIRVSTAGKEVNKINIRFEIEDTGIGIPEDKLTKVFDKFTQANRHTSRKFGGTGLGLTITKQLAELQNGTISLKSRLGEGSVFVFTLPYEETTDQLPEIQNQILSDDMIEQMKSKRILLAEDNPFNQVVAVDSILELIPQLKVDIAENGKQAVEMHSSAPYDLIVMDIQMPEMDGYEACRKIRNELPLPARNVPILAMTASVIKEEVQECFNAGMNDFVPKPFNQSELVQKMSSLLLNSRI